MGGRRVKRSIGRQGIRGLLSVVNEEQSKKIGHVLKARLLWPRCPSAAKLFSAISAFTLYPALGFTSSTTITSRITHHITSAMSYSTASPSYTLFATSPASPNAFSLFGASQSPRETYHLYEDARQVFGPSNGRTAQRKNPKGGLKKYLGL